MIPQKPTDPGGQGPPESCRPPGVIVKVSGKPRVPRSSALFCAYATQNLKGLGLGLRSVNR
eukprot:2801887-Alexandrium_andersonii.AAC.1